jgi:hypothetical protein
MFDVVVYFAGPLSVWSQKPHPREVLARRSSRWRWLALARGQAVLSSVDSGRCGFVVMKDGNLIHHEPAKDEHCNPLPGESAHFDMAASGAGELVEMLSKR